MILVALLTAPLAVAAPPRGQAPDVQFEEVVLGESHGCGRRADGTVACWGRNDRGQLGDGTFESSSFPRAVRDVAGAVGLAAGSFHTCAVLRDRSVLCWGDNQSGQLGAGTLDAQVKPVRVESLGPVLSLAAGDAHTCAVTTDRSVSCWGNNLYRQLGFEGLRSVPRPVPIPAMPAMIDVAAGYGHTCAIGPEGPPWCWGDPSHGQLGRPVPPDRALLPPAPVEGDLPPAMRALAARGNQTCVLHADGVHCWGASPTATAPAPALEQVVRQRGLVALSVGWGHGCALAGSGEVTCWGDDRFGQLGSLQAKRGVAQGAYGLKDASSVAAGNGETCAARSGRGRSVCWGTWTSEEKQAASLERPTLLALPAPRRRQLAPGVELTVSMEELLGHEGTKVRVVVHSVTEHPCANTKLDAVVEPKGKRVLVKLGPPFLPGGACIPSPGPAAATIDLDDWGIGRRDLVLRWKKREDFYQLYGKLNRLEVIPLEETFSSWEGEKVLGRVPPGSLAISCSDHLEEPLCQRRQRDGLPTCATVLGHGRVRDAPSIDERKPLASAWFVADPDATRISPDFEVEGYRAFFEDEWRDGSGCLDVRVRTWRGETWRNTHPGNR